MSKISELSDGGVIQGGDTLIAVRSGGNVKVTYGGTTTANIDGGTIDGTTIGGTTPAAGNFTTLTADGLTVEDGAPVVNISSTTLADLATIQFTTSGSTVDSKITHQANTGVMTIDSGRNATWGGKIDFVTDTDTRMRINNNGDISFYEDTGTTAKLFWDASEERLGIGTSLPANLLHVKGASAGALDLARFRLEGATNNPMLKIEADEANQTAGIDVSGSTTTELTFSQGGAERMRIDSNGNVGIGTDSPSSVVHAVDDTSTVYDATAYQSDLIIERKNTSGSNQSAHIRFNVTGYEGSTTGEASIGVVQTANASSADIVFTTRNAGTRAERMRIDSSGNVGIGTDSPASGYNNTSALDVSGPILARGAITAHQTNAGVFQYNSNETAIRSYGATSGSGLITFSTGGGGAADTERMRIDSSGKLLVGTTHNSLYNSSTQAHAGALLDGVNDNIQIARWQGTPLFVNRMSTDGDLVDFRKDGSTVGSISTVGGVLVVGNGDTGLLFSGSGDYITPRNASTQAARDAAIDLGTSADRFKDLYLSGGAYLGGTGSANKLDDYEEGTWTPIVRGSGTNGSYTYSNGLGVYTKVGRQVTLSFYLGDITEVTAGTGYLQIHGCPFTKGSSQFFAGSVTLQSINWNNANSYGLLEFTSSSATSTLYVRLNGDNSSGSDLQISELISGSSDIGGTITFFV